MPPPHLLMAIRVAFAQPRHVRSERVGLLRRQDGPHDQRGAAEQHDSRVGARGVLRLPRLDARGMRLEAFELCD